MKGLKFSTADKILIPAMLALCLLFSYFSLPDGAGAERSGRKTVVILTPGGGRLEKPLEADATLAVEGAIGTITVIIENGSVRIKDSPCPNKICMKTGKINRQGEQIICAPGKTAVFIKGSGKDGIDESSF